MNKPNQFELPGAEVAFNLAGEETIDGAKVQSDLDAAAQAAAEAKAKQDREQLSLMPGKHEAQTPYQRTKAAGIKSSFYSPDGFCKIEEFENGARFLHDPLIGYPVSLQTKQDNLNKRKNQQTK